ncbi:MAG: hypothetical protein AAF502_22520 [Bacteroidota bacterium]
MNLEELVTYFRNEGSFKQFCESRSLALDTEVVEIYMKKPISIENDLAFFEIEKSGGNLEHTENEITYFYLFDFYYFLDAIEESNNDNNQSLSNAELAQQLLAYAINDA